MGAGINAALAAGGVGLCWWLLGRIGVRRLVDRFALAVLFGFSTQIRWVTTRGGVWHTGQLIATILTFLPIELWGKPAGLAHRAARRGRVPDPGPARVRDPVLRAAARSAAGVAAADVARRLIRAAARSIQWRAWALLGLGVLPSLVVFFGYNHVRFGSPLESGYALATLPPCLEPAARPGPVLPRARRR